MSQDIKEAIESLEKWTSNYKSIHKKPKKVEYSTTFFTDNGVKCITLKFKMGIFGKWLLGISSDAGTYSAMKPFNKETEIEDAKQMIEILKNLWNDVGDNNQTDNNNDFLSTVKK